MKPLPDPSMLTRKQLTFFIFTILILSSVICAVIATILPNNKVYILLPTMATISIFLIFMMILKWRVGDNLFGELGFLYLALAVAYTVFPAFRLIIVDLKLASGWVPEKLTQLLPAPFELGIHLWRHVLFVFGVSAGYLLIRGHGAPKLGAAGDPGEKDRYIIIFLIGLIALCILSVTLLSAPVTTYIDNYTRFDHLSWFSLRFVYICMILKTGSYFILLTLLFRYYKRYKLLMILIVLIICTYELVYSFGSRIEALTILLGSVCLYHYMVRRITLKMGLISFLVIAMLFTAVEVFRSSGFQVDAAKDMVSNEGVKPASEFSAVYFTGFHLYAERDQGSLPPKEWPMFFNDFISLIPFADHMRWNPEYWYARNYFPNAVVPPETMGPIANSAIWGGEIDLLFRSLINGALFAYLIRWFLLRKDKWWAVVIYVYIYATCIMTLKYDIFYQLAPLFKILMPALLMVEVVRRLIPSKRRSGLSNLA